MVTDTMKLLILWITIEMYLCHQPQIPFLRYERISFQLDSRASMTDLSGPVFHHVSKVKCTLICFENTSCTSVFYWKNEGKCRTTTAPQAPAGQGEHGNTTRSDPKGSKHDPESKATRHDLKANKQDLKVNRQDPNSKATIQDPKEQVYYGVLRNLTSLSPSSTPTTVSDTGPDRDDPSYLFVFIGIESMIFQPKVWIYFKEIDLYLIYYNDHKLFQEAEQVCNDLEGETSLFQVDSQRKQDIAVRLVEHSAQEKIFIGMYYDIPFGWRYIDRSLAKYTNWAPGKANYSQFARSAMLVKKSGYKWKTTGFKEMTGWICQKKPPK